MLVISQKKGDKLYIGRDITISILELRSGKVSLGIEAPDNCPIMRDALLRENKALAKQFEHKTHKHKKD